MLSERDLHRANGDEQGVKGLIQCVTTSCSGIRRVDRIVADSTRYPAVSKRIKMPDRVSISKVRSLPVIT